MKGLALVLGLVVAGAQSFPPDDCACEAVAAAAPDCADGCCGAPESEPAGCMHAEPSPDIAAPAPGETVVPPAPALVLPSPPPGDAPESTAIDGTTSQFRRPARGRPLYLLDATLLI